MERRSTRSQVSLPDDILQIPQRSPMKDARSARRSEASEGYQSSGSNEDDEDDDELLLSPQKHATSPTPPAPVRAKRSASPSSVIGDSGMSSSSPEGRKSKRVKRDLISNKKDEAPLQKGGSSVNQRRRSSHSRNLSDSSVAVLKRSSRHRTIPPSLRPKSSASDSPIRHASLPPASRPGRAQSVPVFPTSFSYPHIDFTNLPPSPTRSRSRSPSKGSTPKLRIVPLPNPPFRLEPIPDEVPARMDVDGDSAAPQVFHDNASLEDQPPSLPELNPPDVAEVSARASIDDHPSPKAKISEEVQLQEPATPIPIAENNFTLSPLTPLPETPQPSKFATSNDQKIKALDWDIAIDKPERQSRLPRPSTSAIAPAPVSGLQKPSGPQSGASKLPGERTDAFQYMMKRAGHKLGGLGKAISTSQPLKSIFKTEVGGGVGKEEEKPLAKGVKGKMKPKTAKIGVKPPPALVPIPSDEEDGGEQEMEGSDSRLGSPFTATFVLESKSVEETEPPLRSLTLADIVNPESSESVSKKTETADPMHSSPIDEGPTLPEPTYDFVVPLKSEEVTVSRPSTSLAMSTVSLETQQDGSSSRKSLSKLPVGKKRVPASITTTSRVTRSSSLRKAGEDTKASVAPKPKQLTLNFSSSIKRPGTEKTSASSNSPSTKTTNKETLPPGSPMKVETPVRRSPRYLTTSKSTPALKTPSVSPTKSRIPLKATSPDKKVVRSASMFMAQPNGSQTGANGSSLSTLANALEQLRMPPPCRPSTSMGFNRDNDEDDDDSTLKARIQSQDDIGLGKRSTAPSDLEGAALGRSATLGANHFSNKGQAARSTDKGLKQMPLAFAGRGAGRGKPFFGIGGAGGRRTAPKASKNPSLPSVMGSPVKGGDPKTAMVEDENDNAAPDGDILVVSTSHGSDSTMDGHSTKGKGKERAFEDYSRRASMASHLLSQSLSSVAPEPIPGAGFMGPPALPSTLTRVPARSVSSTYPSTSQAGEQLSSNSTPPGRRSTRVAAAAATQAIANASSSSRKSAAEPEKPAVDEALKFLKDCVIFVDVKTEEGEEAGSLFMEMLEGVGARLLTRVGQSCTHIVYKNGLLSTINRYRQLRDPKPLVVGIAWVVECVEQRKKVDETEFLIDLEEVSLFSAPNKRRRSMLPKLMSRELSPGLSTDAARKEDPHDGDASMDTSSSSITVDDLPPLERARRRRSMLPGPL